MCNTIEPGIYFITPWLEQAKENKDVNKFINFDAIEPYMSVGGVRIEDDCIVMKDGPAQSMCSKIPRTVEDIEAFMKID